ncbi:MAG: protein phosphatase 2C domain-containing protein [Aggregatilineales bacterium]
MFDDSYSSQDIHVLRLLPDENGKMDIVAHENQKFYSEGDLRVAFRVKQDGDKIAFSMTLLSERSTTIVVDKQSHPLEAGESVDIYSGSHVSISGTPYTAVIEVREITNLRPKNLINNLCVNTRYAIAPGGRRDQQDALGFYSQDSLDGTREYLWLVADGVTGANRGEVASNFAVEFVLWYFFNTAGDPLDRLIEGVLQASREIADYSKQITAYHRMADPEHRSIRVATTMTAVAMVDKKWHIVIVGDSSAFLYNPYGSEKVRWFEQADAREPDTGYLRVALGKPSLSRDDIMSRTLDVGILDFMLLCTDGLTDVLPPSNVVNKFHNVDLASEHWTNLPNEFIQEIYDFEGDDNIAILLARLDLKDFGNVFKDASPHVHLRLPDERPMPLEVDEQDINTVTDSAKEDKKPGFLGRFLKK